MFNTELYSAKTIDHILSPNVTGSPTMSSKSPRHMKIKISDLSYNSRGSKSSQSSEESKSTLSHSPIAVSAYLAPNVIVTEQLLSSSNERIENKLFKINPETIESIASSEFEMQRGSNKSLKKTVSIGSLEDIRNKLLKTGNKSKATSGDTEKNGRSKMLKIKNRSHSISGESSSVSPARADYSGTEVDKTIPFQTSSLQWARFVTLSHYGLNH
jgi:hypothetical protein